MIDDVDAALRAYLSAELPAGLAEELSFHIPTPEWSATVRGTTLNLFLCDVRENLQARAGEWADVRDESGQLVGRQPPVRRYDLAYLASAWGGTVESQHALLGAVLALLPAYDSIPTEHLGGRLAGQRLSVGLRLGESGTAWQLWGSLGQPARSAVVLVATAPVRPAVVTDLAPPASSIDVGLGAKAGRPGQSPSPDLAEPAGSGPLRGPGARQPEPPAGVRPGGKPAGWTAYRVREQPPPVREEADADNHAEAL